MLIVSIERAHLLLNVFCALYGESIAHSLFRFSETLQKVYLLLFVFIVYCTWTVVSLLWNMLICRYGTYGACTITTFLYRIDIKRTIPNFKYGSFDFQNLLLMVCANLNRFTTLLFVVVFLPWSQSSSMFVWYTEYVFCGFLYTHTHTRAQAHINIHLFSIDLSSICWKTIAHDSRITTFRNFHFYMSIYWD